MSLWHIAWRYLWRRTLVTLLTVIGVMLGSALICAVLTLHRETEQAFTKESSIFDLVVGAKGSPLQLVLSSIYHLDIPTGNIPYSQYENLKKDRRVKTAIPIGLGDNFRGFRIVGTIPEFFEITQRRSKDEPEEKIFSFAEGVVFQNSFEAVLGAQVAKQSGLKTGDTFHSSHGLISLPGTEDHDQFPFTVVGILQSSGTANDRAVFCSLDSVWHVHDAEYNRQGEEEIKRETTAVLLQLKIPGMRMFLMTEIQDKTGAMAAVPINEILRLSVQVMGPVKQVLIYVAYLVVIVAALTVLCTLYQSAERRRRDMAVLRTLGAHPFEIFILMLLEAVLLTATGVISGWLLGHGGLYIAGLYMQEATGITINAWSTGVVEWAALGWVVLAGTLAGLFPAGLIYRVSPVKDLSAV
jgi:putative ABC transport system permease protein